MATRRRRVIWTNFARNSLHDVADYIARESPWRAEHVVRAALNAATELEWFPERGRVVPELRDHEIREVFVFRYRLQYLITDKRVVIIALLHGSRRFGG